MGERCQGTRQANCGPCERHSTSPHADVPEPSSAYTFSFRSSQAIDTGTSLIYVPSALASAFYGLIPGSKRASQYGSGELSHMKGRQSLKRFPSGVPFFFLIQIGFWTVPCFSVKQVELSFDGYRFAINSSDFYLGRVSASSTDCVGGVLSIGNGLPSNLAIIGDEFLKSCEFLSGVDVFGFVFTPFIV
jgi:hypothetical protein